MIGFHAPPPKGLATIDLKHSTDWIRRAGSGGLLPVVFVAGGTWKNDIAQFYLDAVCL
jgi:hypothetical protein